MHGRLAIIAVSLLLVGCAAPRMQRVRVSPDGKGFALTPSGERFVPWGHNYAANGLESQDQRSWDKIERDLVDLHDMRANVIRIHLEFAQFMDSPGRPNPAALKRLAHLLELSEKHGIYLDLTGLACYRKDHRAAWYDALPDRRRWAVQAQFWEAVAQTCADSPAVFCYDLMNEPVVPGTPKDSWYLGALGGYEFLQRLSRDQTGRPLDDIAKEWTHTLVAAIRQRDKRHLITIGMLPAWGVSQQAVGPELDFIAVHIYPSAGKVPEALADLKRFDIGKPIVIEETFPLSCGVPDERDFLLKSRTLAAGWLGQYPEESPAELRALRRSGKIAAGQSMYLSWIELFEEVGPRMTENHDEGGEK
ncbi:MAG: ugpQ 2 [Phycisphaerales bacterium]|nr:ugpQ 2 [Phycisphaerales bacterium]